MTHTVEEKGCSLCEASLPDHPSYSREGVFCCHGCQTVHAILLARGELKKGKQSSLYQEALRIGAINNPQFTPKEGSLADSAITLSLEIEEMWCPSCATLIEWVFSVKKGVSHCRVDYATDMATLRYDPKQHSQEELIEAISFLGYRPHPFGEENRRRFSRLSLKTVIAVFFTLQVMLVSYPLYWNDAPSLFSLCLSFVCSLPVLIVGLLPLLRRFFFSLVSGVFGMETLIVLSTTTGFLVSVYSILQGYSTVYFDSICALLSFLLLGKCFEQQAKFSAKNTLTTLIQSIPKKARRRDQKGKEEFIPLKEVQKGDCLVVLPGEKVVLDGVVVEGEGACDESTMTGEMLPQSKEKGASLLGGSTVIQGKLHFCVMHTWKETAFQEMIDVLQGDLSQGKGRKPMIDNILPFFIPFVLLVALGTLLFSNEEAFLRAFSVLLMACPCAIGLAAPLAEATLLHRLAKKGILVRNRSILSILGRETRFAFDKTGTLTKGECRVASGLEGLTSRERSLLKGLAASSTHPLSQAVCYAIGEEPISLERTQEHMGLGIQGEYQGELFLFGSERYLTRHGIFPEKSQQRASSAFFASTKSVIGEVVFCDTIRTETKEFVKTLPVPTAVLSGDHPAVVEAVANECGIALHHAHLHPLEKREIILEWQKQGERVAMVGDGINDAAALGVADIGIAVFSATDITQQVADIILTHPDLRVLSFARKQARFTQKIITQNFLWAFGYNSIGMMLAVLGLLTPLFAATGMLLSSAVLLINAWRGEQHCLK